MNQLTNRINQQIIKLLPVGETIEENQEFVNNPLCQETIFMTMDFYHRAGFDPPWIGYYAFIDNQIVGSCAFKGKPVNGMVEIAYGTIEKFRGQGIGTAICARLVDMALQNDSSVKITARTLREESGSTHILLKNNFFLNGTITDPDDGEVWEWIYRG
jgi:ribosomal-protein-alanine N-acetyltransferase